MFLVHLASKTNQSFKSADLLKTNYNIGFDGVEDIGKQPGGIELFCPETHCC